MTEGGRRDDGRVSWMVRLSQVVAVVTGLALLATMACDTVARIPTEDRTFRHLYPVTISPHDVGEAPEEGEPGCGTLGDTSVNPAVMSMVLLDDNREPIKPGEEVERVDVALDRDNISLDGGTLYSIPDVPCEDHSLCSGELRCDPVEDVDGNRCQESSDVFVVGDPEFAGEEPDSQAFGVAVADVGRWGGRYHDVFEGKYEFDPDDDNRPLGFPIEDDVAMDSGGHRINALRDVASEWARLSNYVVEREREAYFGYWLFQDSSAQVRSQIPGGQQWTQDPDVATDVVQQGPFSTGRAGVYNSMIRIMNDAYINDGVVAEVDEKHLLFLVAGYDEHRSNTVDDVIEVANANDIAVSVVQVDDEIAEPSYLRDDEEYYRDQYGSPCSDDSLCANYETCREPKQYAESEHTNDPSDVVWPDAQSGHSPGDKYCLPDYDDKGRVGPILEYQRLACATGGSYNYVPDVGRSVIADPMIGQLWAPEAAWEFGIDFERHPQRTDSGEAYLLETELDVTIGRSQDHRFEIGTETNSDTREVFFAE